MKSFGLPVCPYCGKKVDLITTWFLRRQGEYRCPRCRGISTVVMDMKTTFFAIGAVITALLIFFIGRVVKEEINLSIIIWILVPFVLFYLVSIFWSGCAALWYAEFQKRIKKEKYRNLRKISVAADMPIIHTFDIIKKWFCE